MCIYYSFSKVCTVKVVKWSNRIFPPILYCAGYERKLSIAGSPKLHVSKRKRLETILIDFGKIKLFHNGHGTLTVSKCPQISGTAWDCDIRLRICTAYLYREVMHSN